MKRLATLIAAGALLAGAAAQESPSKLGETRNVLKEWVDLRKLISEERSEWAVEKQTLKESISLLQTELETLQQNIEQWEEEATAAERKRAELSEQEEALKEASSVVTNVLRSLESKILAMRDRFPAPLKGRISTATDRMPKDDEEASKVSLSNRMQYVIGALTEIEKFNNQITLQSEMQEINGENVQVNTLYVGLAGGYYVDGTLTEAGIVAPGENGWVRESRPDLAGKIARAVSIYQKEEEAAFVNLPIDIK